MAGAAQLVVLLWRAQLALTGGPLPNRWKVMALLAIAVGLTVWTERTLLGRYLYAVGGNARAAELSGIHVRRFRIPVVDAQHLIEATGEFWEFPMCDRFLYLHP